MTTSLKTLTYEQMIDDVSIPQRFFDETVNYLRSMEQRAMKWNVNQCMDVCAYLSSNGSKCAIGYWFNDDMPKTITEFVGPFSEIIKEFPTEILEFSPVVAVIDAVFINSLPGYRLLYELQQLHDDVKNWVDGHFNGEVGIEFIAESYGLIYTQPTKTKDENA